MSLICTLHVNLYIFTNKGQIMTTTNDRPDLSSEGAPAIDKTITRKCQTEINVRSQDPHGARIQDLLVVGRNDFDFDYSSEFRRVMSEYSGRGAVFREELQSFRRTDPAILEDRQPVKIQCEDAASVIVNCSEL
jgi:hypothetical protein